MRFLTILAVILSASMAAAETKITELPDRIIVELVGTPEKKPAASAGADDDGAAEKRAYLSKEMQRLQRERQELMKKQDWDPPEEVRRKREEAQERQKEISRITAELARLKERSSPRQ